MSSVMIATRVNDDDADMKRRKANAASARQCRINRKQANATLVCELETARELIDRLTNRVTELEDEIAGCRCGAMGISCPWPLELDSQSQSSIYDVLA